MTFSERYGYVVSGAAELAITDGSTEERYSGTEGKIGKVDGSHLGKRRDSQQKMQPERSWSSNKMVSTTESTARGVQTELLSMQNKSLEILRSRNESAFFSFLIQLNKHGDKWSTTWFPF